VTVVVGIQVFTVTVVAGIATVVVTVDGGPEVVGLIVVDPEVVGVGPPVVVSVCGTVEVTVDVTVEVVPPQAIAASDTANSRQISD
jgi:hypothetical protein